MYRSYASARRRASENWTKCVSEFALVAGVAVAGRSQVSRTVGVVGSDGGAAVASSAVSSAVSTNNGWLSDGAFGRSVTLGRRRQKSAPRGGVRFYRYHVVFNVGPIHTWKQRPRRRRGHCGPAPAVPAGSTCWCERRLGRGPARPESDQMRGGRCRAGSATLLPFCLMDRKQRTSRSIRRKPKAIVSACTNRCHKLLAGSRGRPLSSCAASSACRWRFRLPAVGRHSSASSRTYHDPTGPLAQWNVSHGFASKSSC